VVVLAPRDVAGEGAEGELAAVRDGGDGELQREALRAGALGFDLQAVVGRLVRVASLEQAQALAQRLALLRGEDQLRQLAPQRLLPREAEGLLRLRVPEADPPVRVERDHGVERVVEDRADMGGAGAAPLGQTLRIHTSTLTSARGVDKRPLPSIGTEVRWILAMRLGITEYIDCAHFLPGHPKCGQVHGHTYKVEVIIEGEASGGMVVDFTDLKTRTREVLAQYDHRHWNDVLEVPTVENICQL